MIVVIRKRVHNEIVKYIYNKLLDPYCENAYLLKYSLVCRQTFYSRDVFFLLKNNFLHIVLFVPLFNEIRWPNF